MAVGVIDHPKSPEIVFQVNEVMKLTPLGYDLEGLLPHRGNWLLVSKILYYGFGSGVVIINYDVSDHPSWQADHFPGAPIMPGFLIAEHGAQAGAIFAGLSGTKTKSLPYLARADGLKFQKVVRPGDKLYTQAQVVDWDGEINKRVWRFNFLVKNQFSEDVASGLIVGVSKR